MPDGRRSHGCGPGHAAVVCTGCCGVWRVKLLDWANDLRSAVGLEPHEDFRVTERRRDPAAQGAGHPASQEFVRQWRLWHHRNAPCGRLAGLPSAQGAAFPRRGSPLGAKPFDRAGISAAAATRHARYELRLSGRAEEAQAKAIFKGRPLKTGSSRPSRSGRAGKARTRRERRCPNTSGNLGRSAARCRCCKAATSRAG
jgi:hypothetical protein